MNRTVYVYGSFVPEVDARVSPFDRGYLFADGVYEVTAVIGGRLIDYGPHMERLGRSLRELGMAWPCSEEELHRIHEELIARNGLEEGVVYMQVTRGVAERDFAFPADARSQLFAFTQEKELVDSANARSGVRVITVPDIRWQRRDIKSIALLPQCLGKQKAVESGAFEAWMVDADDMITEGTSSSAYIVRNETVITRPLSNTILPGVTRRSLLALAARHGIALEERSFSIEEATRADEAFLTSASSFVLPVVGIDGHAIGGGRPGPVVKRLREIYLEAARQ